MKLHFKEKFLASSIDAASSHVASGSGEARAATIPSFGLPSIASFIQILERYQTEFKRKGNHGEVPNTNAIISSLRSEEEVESNDLQTLLGFLAPRDHDVMSLLIYHLIPNCLEPEGVNILVNATRCGTWYPTFARNSESSGMLRPSLLDALFLSGNIANISWLATTALASHISIQGLKEAISLSITINPKNACTTFAGLDKDLQGKLASFYADIETYDIAIPGITALSEKILALTEEGPTNLLIFALERANAAGILRIKSPEGKTLLEIAKDTLETYKYLISKMTYQDFPFVALLRGNMQEDAARIFKDLASTNPGNIRDFFTLAKQLDDSSFMLEILQKLLDITYRDDIIEFLVDHERFDTIKYLSESEVTAERVKIRLDDNAADSFLIKYQALHEDEAEKLELMKKFIELGADPLAGGNDSAMAVALTHDNQNAVKCHLDVMSQASKLSHLEIVATLLNQIDYFPALCKFVTTYSSKLQQLKALHIAINKEVTEHSKAMIKIIAGTYAGSEDDFAVFKALLDNAATDAGDNSELMEMAKVIVEYLNDQEIFNINSPARKGDKASLVGHYASTGTPEAYETLKILLGLNKVNLEVTDKNGHTPLMAALANKCSAEFNLLLSANADKNPQNSAGEGLLHVAMRADNSDMLEEATMILSRNIASKYHYSMKDAVKMATEEIAVNKFTPLRSGLFSGSYSSVSALLLKHHVLLNDELFEMANLVSTGCAVHPISEYPKILDFVFAYSVALLQNNMAQFTRGFQSATTEAARIAYVDDYLSKLIPSQEAPVGGGEAAEESKDEADDELSCLIASRPPLEVIKSAFIDYLNSLRGSKDTIIVMRSISEFIHTNFPALDAEVAEKQLTKHMVYSEEVDNLRAIYSKALASEALVDDAEASIVSTGGAGAEASSYKEVKVSVAQTDPADFKFAASVNLDLEVDVSDSRVNIAPEILGDSSSGGDFDD